jgi:hypothetical protein
VAEFNLKVSKLKLSPVGLSDAKNPTQSRQLDHRWR